jgi:hypothetical protein
VPIDPAKVYGVVTNNYVRNGGDGYRMFVDAANAYDFGPPLENVVADFMAATGGSLHALCRRPDHEGGVTPSAAPQRRGAACPCDRGGSLRRGSALCWMHVRTLRDHSTSRRHGAALRGAACERPAAGAELQRLPDEPHPCRGLGRGRAAARRDALGLHPALVQDALGRARF